MYWCVSDPSLYRTQDRDHVCLCTQQLLSTGLWMIVPGNLVQGSVVDIDGGTEVARTRSFCALNSRVVTAPAAWVVLASPFLPGLLQ